MKVITVVFGMLAVASVALAADLPPLSGTFFDQVMLYLSNIGPAAIASFLAFVEFILRIVPTANPASLLMPVKRVLDVIIYCLGFASELIAKLVVVGQRLK